MFYSQMKTIYGTQIGSKSLGSTVIKIKIRHVSLSIMRCSYRCNMRCNCKKPRRNNVTTDAWETWEPIQNPEQQ